MRFGKRCACRAAIGRCGRSSKAVCVDVIVAPFGSLTVIPCVVRFLLVHGLFICRKWPVHPESANAVEAGWGEL